MIIASFLYRSFNSKSLNLLSFAEAFILLSAILRAMSSPELACLYVFISCSLMQAHGPGLLYLFALRLPGRGWPTPMRRVCFHLSAILLCTVSCCLYRSKTQCEMTTVFPLTINPPHEPAPECAPV